MKEDWKVKFDPDIVLMDTMDLVIVPVQEQVGGLLLTEILEIIDRENIIRTGHYRESINPISLPTRDNPTIEIASVDCDYAVHLEYGTYKQKPKAVFRRAMETVKEHLTDLEVIK